MLGQKMTRTAIKKTITDAPIGSSVAELPTCESESSSAGYVATERVNGTLDGRAGTFVIQQRGILDGTTGNATPYGAIIPGSVPGEFVGLCDSAAYRHDDQCAIITLHYDI